MWSKENVAWMAGLFEADGYCMKPLGIRIDMADRDVIEQFRDFSFPELAVQGPCPPSGHGKKDRYKVTITSKKAYALFVAMWPWLGERRRQRVAECAWAWIEHGRKPRYNQKLTVQDVRDIKRRIADGDKGIGRVLADEYEVSTTTIARINTGKAWARV